MKTICLKIDFVGNCIAESTAYFISTPESVLVIHYNTVSNLLCITFNFIFTPIEIKIFEKQFRRRIFLFFDIAQSLIFEMSVHLTKNGRL